MTFAVQHEIKYMYVAVLRVQPLGRTTSALHSRYVSFSVGAERSLICIYLYSLLSSLALLTFSRCTGHGPLRRIISITAERVLCFYCGLHTMSPSRF